MRASPGGEIAPKDVVGRNRLIQRLWETLGRQSLILVAERRMGKSCVVKKMIAEGHAGMVTVYRDVEGVTTPFEFAEYVDHDVETHLNRLGKTARKVKGLLQQLAGLELAKLIKLPQTVAPHWKALLERAVEDLAKQQDQTVVLFWDELPLMLKKIRESTGEAAAMEVLDTLRGLRQMHGRVRMVYTGSIGLHHVTTALREAGHANDATNDMRSVEVPELSVEDAAFLARELLKGEELACDDPQATARQLAEEVDCIPFYVHWVVASLKDRGDVASGDLVSQVVSEALVDPQDPWHLGHYRDRLKEYYGQERLPVVLALLDDLSLAPGALALDELASRVAVRVTPDSGETAARILGGDRELLRGILLLLQRDHYLRQQPEDGSYRFRFPLIARWWRVHRNLP